MTRKGRIGILGTIFWHTCTYLSTFFTNIISTLFKQVNILYFVRYMGDMYFQHNVFPDITAKNTIHALDQDVH